MPAKNYPGGVASYGTPLIGVTVGNVFFVKSGTGTDAAGYGADPANPFSSIDYAVGQCSASNGDVIIVLPGHTETVDAAGDLALDVQGITIIGFGHGSDRPTVDFTTVTTADMDVDAANITIHNILFTGNVDALAGPIDINAADCRLIDCEWRDVTGQCTVGIAADANADRLLIKDFRYDGSGSAGTTAGIQLTGADRVVIEGLRMDMAGSAGIRITTTAVTDLEVRDVWFRTRNSSDTFLVDTITGSTGVIGPDVYMRLADDAANITEAINGPTFVVMDHGVHVVNAAGEKSIAINWTASTDA